MDALATQIVGFGVLLHKSAVYSHLVYGTAVLVVLQLVALHPYSAARLFLYFQNP